MGRETRGGYIFVWFKGDHSPSHIHIYKDRKLIAKYDLINRALLAGMINKKLEKLVDELMEEGVFNEIM